MEAHACSNLHLNKHSSCTGWVNEWMAGSQNTDLRESVHQNHLLARNSLLSEGSPVYHFYDSQKGHKCITFLILSSFFFTAELLPRKIHSKTISEQSEALNVLLYIQRAQNACLLDENTKNHTIQKEASLGNKTCDFHSLPLFAQRGHGGSEWEMVTTPLTLLPLW